MSTERMVLHRPETRVPHGVIGILLFIITELMFFTGLVSAYLISATSNPGVWPPANQPRLPGPITGVNTLVLLASGVLVFLAGRAWDQNRERTRELLLAAFLLGGSFVGVQGAEWAALIRQGLTLTFSVHGSYFFLIVGSHAVHAIGALAALFWAYRQQVKGALTQGGLWTVQLFWFFVVGVWPVLYYLVYLK
jgi:heme/copper-type cytochrome/quinol oxidase subunit 3